MNKTNFFGNRKAQITLFIIIGIVILIIGGLIIGLSKKNLVELDSERIFESLSETTTETQPIQTYVHACIYKVGKDAIIKLGRNGGYIDPTDYFSLGYKPTESEVIVSGANILPYWNFYDESSSKFNSLIPWLKKEKDSEKSIEIEIAKYVQKNIGSCLNNFKPFRNEFRIATEKPLADVVVNDDGVYIQLDMKTTIKPLAEEKTYELKNYGETVDIPLKRIYEFALDLTTEEKYGAYIERLILELIGLYSGLDTELPPTYDITVFQPEEKFWIHNNVETKIRKEILPYINMIQIVDTLNYNTVFHDKDSILQSSLEDTATTALLNPVVKDYSDLSVNFMYPNLRPDIKIAGGVPVLSPRTTANVDDDNIFSKLMGAVMKIYKFGYDLSFPVITRVCYPEAFSGEGYCFYFAMEGNIRSNQPLTPYTYNLRTLYSNIGVGDGFITEKTNVDIGSILQRVNKDISFELIDENTYEPITNARIYYSCGKEFYVGTTKDIGGNALFSDKLPYCASGGRIVIRKTDYFDYVLPFNNLDEGADVDLGVLKMWPVKEMKVEVKKRPYPSFSSSDSLEEKDLVIVEIVKLKEKANEPDFPFVPMVILGDMSSSTSYDFGTDMISQINAYRDEGYIDDDASGLSDDIANIINDEIDSETYQGGFVETGKVSLVPGRYNLKVMYTLKGTIDEPAVHLDSEHWRICLSGKIKKNSGRCFITVEHIYLDELNLKDWFVSSYESNFTITQEDIYNNDKIIISTADLGIPTNYDELESYSKRSSRIITQKMIPRFE